MALIIEDGTGKVDAESWATVAETIAFLDARARTGTSNAFTALATEGEQERVLRKAFDFVGTEFRPQFPGYRTNETQLAEWPRISAVTQDGQVFASNEIPVQVKRAQMLAAYEIAKDTTGHELAPLRPPVTNEGSLTAKTIKAGPVTISKSWSGASQTTTHQIVEATLGRILVPGGRVGLA